MSHRSSAGVLALCAGALAGSAQASVFYGVTSNSTLIRIDTTSATATTLASTISTLEDCDFDAGGTLWAMRTGNIGGFPPQNVCQAYTINTVTGAATPQGNFGSGATLESLALRPSNSTFYSINELGGTTNGHLVTADLVGGSVTTVSGSPHNLPGGRRVDALAFSPGGTLYGVWNSNAGGPFGSNIYDLVSFDLGTGQGTIIGAIGPSSRSFVSLRFDSAGTAYTVDTFTGDVFTVNLGTGAGTFLFAGGAAAVGTRGLAFVPAPAGAASLGLGLLGIGRRRR